MDVKSAGNRDPISKMSRELGTFTIDEKIKFIHRKRSRSEARIDRLHSKLSNYIGSVSCSVHSPTGTFIYFGMCLYLERRRVIFE